MPGCGRGGGSGNGRFLGVVLDALEVVFGVDCVDGSAASVVVTAGTSSARAAAEGETLVGGGRARDRAEISDGRVTNGIGAGVADGGDNGTAGPASACAFTRVLSNATASPCGSTGSGASGTGNGCGPGVSVTEGAGAAGGGPAIAEGSAGIAATITHPSSCELVASEQGDVATWLGEGGGCGAGEVECCGNGVGAVAVWVAATGAARASGSRVGRWQYSAGAIGRARRQRAAAEIVVVDGRGGSSEKG